MKSLAHCAKLFATLVLLTTLNSVCHAQPFSFVGLKWGEPYDTVNRKLVAAGFSKMLELDIQQDEPVNAPKVRLFEGGQLLRQPARGAIYFSNNKLMGVQVYLKAQPDGLKELYAEVLSSLNLRYGRPNEGVSNPQADWGGKEIESVSLYASPKDGEVVVFYKSREWKVLEQQAKKSEAAKF